MQKIIAYPLTAIYALTFLVILLIFHPIQWVCFKVLGYHPHRISVAYLNLSLLRCAHILGTRYTFHNPHDIPLDLPAIIVSNHQSMNDIPPIVWWMRKFEPKFVSKKELGKGIPSVSYNLRHGGSVLIDRSNKRQSLAKLMEFGKRLHKNNETGVIFPEGTRSRDGVPKTFSESGLKILTRSMPNGYVIPVTLNNSWKLMRYGNFPIGGFSNVTLEVHEPIKIDSCSFDELLERTKRQITKAVK